MSSQLTTATQNQLGRFGFQPMGGRRYRREDMVLDARGPWWTLRCPVSKGEEGEGVDWWSRPGLWLPEDPAGKVQACDLPALALNVLSSSDGDMLELMTWVLATRHAWPPAGQDADGDGSRLSAIPTIEASQLTARSGPFICQGKLVHEGCLRVDFPLAVLPESMSSGRQHWLHSTLVAARRFRMVRVEIGPGTGQGSGTIHTFVDLTGVPPAMLDVLLTQAIACLRSTAERLLPAVAFLADASVASRAVEFDSLAPFTEEEIGEDS